MRGVDETKTERRWLQFHLLTAVVDISTCPAMTCGRREMMDADKTCAL
jgi:hypothetical protein